LDSDQRAGIELLVAHDRLSIGGGGKKKKKKEERVGTSGAARSAVTDTTSGNRVLILKGSKPHSMLEIQCHDARGEKKSRLRRFGAAL